MTVVKPGAIPVPAEAISLANISSAFLSEWWTAIQSTASRVAKFSGLEYMQFYQSLKRFLSNKVLNSYEPRIISISLLRS